MNCPVGWEKWVDKCLREASRWGKPPNWGNEDWQEEMKSVALLALWLAVLSYDHNRSADMEQFVTSRVKSALLQRAREEWRFAKKCCPPEQPSDDAEEDAPASIEEISEKVDPAVFWWHIETRDILSRLPPEEHYLIERLFIDGATEKEVARELGVSQPTVSRWKQDILQKLHRMLEGEEPDPKNLGGRNPK